MLRSELIRRVVEATPGLSAHDGERVVLAVLERISVALERGHRVELRGFGALRVKTSPARKGRNPKTGVFVAVPETRAISFKPGREMRRRLIGAKSPTGVEGEHER